jgi:hypothetical protein
MEVGEGIKNQENHQTLKALRKEVRTLESSPNLQKPAGFVARLVGFFVKEFFQPPEGLLLIGSRW